MAASVTIFQIKLPWLGMLSAHRLFDGRECPFHLAASATPEFWEMAPAEAAALGRAADRIDHHFRWSAKTGAAVRVGSMFSSKDSDGKLIIELGVVADRDNGAAMYLQFLDVPKAMVFGEQIWELLDGLHRLGEDARRIPGGVTSRLAR